MYCTVRDDTAYLLHAACDLLEEEHVDGVELRQVGLALNAKEVVDVFFRSHLLEDLIDVDFLLARRLLNLLHFLRVFFLFKVISFISLSSSIAFNRRLLI